MEDDIILISNLNDFIFCPASIYFHKLYGGQDNLTYQTEAQINGTNAHKAIDRQQYSTKKSVITALDIYSQKYGLVGKIDIYDMEKFLLIERKKHINIVYDGYIFQLYAQYFAMTEMGYKIEKMEIRSMDDNKKYPIKCPNDNIEMKLKFDKLINKMRTFDLLNFQQDNAAKCQHCIYKDACDRTVVQIC